MAFPPVAQGRGVLASVAAEQDWRSRRRREDERALRLEEEEDFELDDDMPERAESRRPRERPRPVESIVGENGEAQISLLTPTRLLPPPHYNSPPRATFPVRLLRTPQIVTDKIFERLKRKARTAAPGTHLSAKADYRMLAAATRRSGDTTRTAIADFNLGVSHDNAENFQSAVESYKRFLERGAAEPAEQCLGLNSLAIAYQCLGQLETALGFHAEHARLASDPRSRVVALCNVGLVHRELGNLDESDRCFQQAVEMARVNDDAAGEMLSSGHLGVNATLRRAMPEFETAAASRRPPIAASALVGSIPADRLDAGRSALESQLSQQQPFDDPRNTAVVRESLGVLAHASGSYREAQEHFLAARTVAQLMGDKERDNLEKCNLGIAVAHERWEALVGRRVQEAAEAARRVAERESVERGLPESVPAVGRPREE